MPWITFVSLSKPTPVITSLPASVKALLEELSSALTQYVPVQGSPLILFGGSDNPALSDFIPLSALLLEYPVAYVPDAESLTASGFLGGVDLQVYSCTLIWRTENKTSCNITATHTFMQFSCPSSLTQQLRNLTDRLRERFSSRIAETRLDWKLQVTSRTECLERVAL
ncbi:hypothetical protein BDY19DRAFT_229123 [Irpex rosettiformis]|uniref:Uncharacterized protein n=1 Tax=Irpex rosettiformis TaxID=378272 RepID=A0ACB8U107_9APHY|nr:hypothetical protein BDY19DRAFT_229123 [Irpex rosettiformis]